MKMLRAPWSVFSDKLLSIQRGTSQLQQCVKSTDNFVKQSRFNIVSDFSKTYIQISKAAKLAIYSLHLINCWRYSEIQRLKLVTRTQLIITLRYTAT